MYKFNENDIFNNVVIAYPSYEFLLYTGSVFFQNRKSDNSNVPNGDLSLYELNVNRTGAKIYPFVVKNGTLDSFKTISTSDFSQFSYGDTITGSYELTSSIATKYYSLGESRPQVTSLKNTLNYYRKVSKKYEYGTNFSTNALSQVSVPSILFGSQIDKGSVELEFYYTGTLIAKAQDIHRNGELIQTYGTSSLSGSTVGVILYNEGFIFLTSSAALSNNTDEYLGTTPYNPAWIYFAANESAASSSACKIKYKGTSKIPTVTMFAHADKIDLNHSNNPTFTTYGQSFSASINEKGFRENPLEIKNIVSGVYNNYSESFQRTTFISSIGIYNEDRVLIGVAKLATPVRKRNNDSYTFKLKLDI
jgi:hypothetical protein